MLTLVGREEIWINRTLFLGVVKNITKKEQRVFSELHGSKVFLWNFESLGRWLGKHFPQPVCFSLWWFLISCKILIEGTHHPQWLSPGCCPLYLVIENLDTVRTFLKITL